MENLNTFEQLEISISPYFNELFILAIQRNQLIEADDHFK